MATINSVNTSLSGQTGTGSFVGSNTPTLTTPILGSANATSIRYSATNMILDSNGAVLLAQSATASAVNYFTVFNSAAGNPLILSTTGSSANRGININTAGDAGIQLLTSKVGATAALIVGSGTGAQHTTSFVFADTAASRTVTFPDANGTVTLLGNSSTGSGNVVLQTTPTLTTPILGVASATSINFGTTALNTYTEGTWVPADYSGAALVFTGVVANYTRIGRMVTASCQVTFPVTASGVGAVIGGLPFASANSTGSQGGVVVFTSVAALELARTIPTGDFLVLLTSVGANVTNLQMSATTVQLQATYFV